MRPPFERCELDSAALEQFQSDCKA